MYGLLFIMVLNKVEKKNAKTPVSQNCIEVFFLAPDERSSYTIQAILWTKFLGTDMQYS